MTIQTKIPVRITGEKSCRISLDGHLDINCFRQVNEAIYGCLECGFNDIEIDMSGVDHVASGIISLFLAGDWQANKFGGALRLTRVPDRIRHILELLGIANTLIAGNAFAERNRLWRDQQSSVLAQQGGVKVGVN